MCNFMSGILFKNRVVLCPIYNFSHSTLLKKLNIEDTNENAMRMFVRAELLPPNDDKTIDVSKWNFKVDQDIVPTWFEEDSERYEKEFRDEVSTFIQKHFKTICGKSCVKMKEDEKGTYYMLSDILFRTEFGEDNNYATSYARQKLQECEFAQELKKEYGNRLVSITTNLLSLDGFDDYGVVEGDILALRTLDLHRECRKNIPNANSWEWLSTPDSTPSGDGSHFVRYVDSNGSVRCNWYGDEGGVRPFFILKPSNL